MITVTELQFKDLIDEVLFVVKKYNTDTFQWEHLKTFCIEITSKKIDKKFLFFRWSVIEVNEEEIRNKRIQIGRDAVEFASKQDGIIKVIKVAILHGYDGVGKYSIMDYCNDNTKIWQEGKYCV